MLPPSVQHTVLPAMTLSGRPTLVAVCDSASEDGSTSVPEASTLSRPIHRHNLEIRDGDRRVRRGSYTAISRDPSGRPVTLQNHRYDFTNANIFRFDYSRDTGRNPVQHRPRFFISRTTTRFSERLLPYPPTSNTSYAATEPVSIACLNPPAPDAADSFPGSGPKKNGVPP